MEETASPQYSAVLGCGKFPWAITLLYLSFDVERTHQAVLEIESKSQSTSLGAFITLQLSLTQDKKSFVIPQRA